LNYAARRTPIAVVSAAAKLETVNSKGAYALEDADDAFDVADAAIERLLSGDFQPMRVSASAIARSPALSNQCARFGIYPNAQATWDAADFVRQARDRVNQIYTASGMRQFMCSNIALAVFSPEC